MTSEVLSGIVQSHTVIRVPGKQQVGAEPFVLLLVELADGRRVLGRFTRSEPPPINSRVVESVVGSVKENEAALFSLPGTKT